LLRYLQCLICCCRHASYLNAFDTDKARLLCDSLCPPRPASEDGSNDAAAADSPPNTTLQHLRFFRNDKPNSPTVIQYEALKLFGQKLTRLQWLQLDVPIRFELDKTDLSSERRAAVRSAQLAALRSIDESVCMHREGRMRLDGVLPAINVKKVSAMIIQKLERGGYPPTYVTDNMVKHPHGANSCHSCIPCFLLAI